MRRECHLVELTCEPGLTSYSIILGYLQAAAEADPRIREHYAIEKHILFQTGDTQALAEELMASFVAPAVVGFSIYFWNRAASLELARRIKARWPGCFIVVGGNDVTYQADSVFAQAPWVDAVAHGEGELIFRNLLLALLEPEPDLSGIKGLSYRDRDGLPRHNLPAERILDLSEVPSPILSGVYDPAVFRKARFIIYETNRGCPFQCAFCFWGGATGTKVRQFPLERVKAELEFIVKHAGPFTTLFIADANFGMLQRDYEIAQWLVHLLDKYRKRLFLATNWAKNTNENVLRTARLLFSHRLLGSVTLSAQSFNPEVLRIARRQNIPPAYYQQLQATFRAAGIPTYTELIWGMPGETMESFKRGIEQVIATGGLPVIYPLLLINNTEYSRPEFRREYQIKTRYLPYQLSNPNMTAEFVVSHARMTEEEWLHGLSLSLTISVFYKALGWAIFWYLHEAVGLRFVDQAELLLDYMTSERCAVRRVRELLQNYRESYIDPTRFDRAGVFAEIGETSVLDYLHYQAIVHHVVRDPERTRSLLLDAADYLYEALPPDQAPPRQTYDAVVNFQIAYLQGWRAIRNRTPMDTVLRVPAPVLQMLIDAGQMAVRGEFAADAEVALRLRVGRDVAVYPFDNILMGIYHGSVRPCSYFGGALPVVSAGRDPAPALS